MCAVNRSFQQLSAHKRIRSSLKNELLLFRDFLRIKNDICWSSVRFSYVNTDTRQRDAKWLKPTWLEFQLMRKTE